MDLESRRQKAAISYEPSAFSPAEKHKAEDRNQKSLSFRAERGISPCLVEDEIRARFLAPLGMTAHLGITAHPGMTAHLGMTAH
jgi:hypothetical protein